MMKLNNNNNTKYVHVIIVKSTTDSKESGC